MGIVYRYVILIYSFKNYNGKALFNRKTFLVQDKL